MKTDEREINFDILVEQLQKAKKNTQTLLDEPNALIDMHGLGYWANEVERLRNLTQKFL